MGYKANMLKEGKSENNLASPRFRCVQPTSVSFDGSVATVTAFIYLEHLEKEYLDCTEHEKRAWKFYLVARKNQQAVELISELELEKRIGTEAFNQLN